MLPFQCSAPLSVKVAKMRRDRVSFARAPTGELRAIIPQWLETGNRDVNFDTLGISLGESTEIAARLTFRHPLLEIQKKKREKNTRNAVHENAYLNFLNEFGGMQCLHPIFSFSRNFRFLLNSNSITNKQIDTDLGFSVSKDISLDIMKFVFRIGDTFGSKGLVEIDAPYNLLYAFISFVYHRYSLWV